MRSEIEKLQTESIRGNRMMYSLGGAVVNVKAESNRLAVDDHTIEINEISGSLQAVQSESKLENLK